MRGTRIAAREVVLQALTGRSREEIARSISFSLVGEDDAFESSEYALPVIYPRGYDYVKNCLTVHLSEIENSNGSPALIGAIRCLPRRSIDFVIAIAMENAIAQVWRFHMKLALPPASPLETIRVECGLDKVATHQVKLAEVCQTRTRCHAHLAGGSASEFSDSESETWIETNLSESVQLLFQVVHRPTTSGKVKESLHVVDTLEVQRRFEFMRQSPGYIPPNLVKSGRIDISLPESAKNGPKNSQLGK
jgi:hypothetical protein